MKIEGVEMQCPLCGGWCEVLTETKPFYILTNRFELEVEYCKCKNCREEFQTEKQIDHALQQASNYYKK